MPYYKYSFPFQLSWEDVAVFEFGIKHGKCPTVHEVEELALAQAYVEHTGLTDPEEPQPWHDVLTMLLQLRATQGASLPVLLVGNFSDSVSLVTKFGRMVSIDVSCHWNNDRNCDLQEERIYTLPAKRQKK